MLALGDHRRKALLDVLWIRAPGFRFAPHSVRLIFLGEQCAFYFKLEEVFGLKKNRMSVFCSSCRCVVAFSMHVNAALASNPGQSELSAGLAARSKSNNVEAVNHFSKAIDAGLSTDARVSVLLLRAQAYTELSDFRQALADCEQGQKDLHLYTDMSDKKTLTAEISAWKGYDELNLNLPTQAIADLKAAVTLHKGDSLEARTRAWLGHAYCLAGRTKEAINEYSLAIASNSKIAEALAGRAFAFRKLGDSAAADRDDKQFKLLAKPGAR